MRFVSKKEDQLTVFLNVSRSLRNSKLVARESNTSEYLGKERKKESMRHC